MGLVALTSAAQAAPVFHGRLADGTHSSTCTVTGPTKCAMFYNTTLNITILNDWNIGRAPWSATAAAGSAQALAESAGVAQTDFSGWFLPTGDVERLAGPANQYLSIWTDIGFLLTGFQDQFDGVQSGLYWSSTGFAPAPDLAMYFDTLSGSQNLAGTDIRLYAVAVRPGDVDASVPEPQTLALALLALGATVVARRRRPR